MGVLYPFPPFWAHVNSGCPLSKTQSLTDRLSSEEEREVNRRSGVYDDSPIIDLDADDDLNLSMPKVINFSAEVNRCDGDTVKRNGKFIH